MPASSHLLGLLIPLGCALALLGCGDTTRPLATTAESGAGQGGSAAGSSVTGLSVMGVMARQNGDCSVESDGAAELLALGTLDRALASGYTAALLLQSKHSERVALRSLDVSLDSSDGTPIDAFSSTVTGFLDGAGGQGSASFGVAIADLLPPTLSQRLEPGRLLLRLTLHAQALSGQAGDLVSARLAFPLELCEGCLVSYPAVARDPASPDGSYLCLTGALAAEERGDAPQPCAPGLDTPVACTTCSDTLPLCRDAALNPSR